MSATIKEVSYSENSARTVLHVKVTALSLSALADLLVLAQEEQGRLIEDLATKKGEVECTFEFSNHGRLMSFYEICKIFSS